MIELNGISKVNVKNCDTVSTTIAPHIERIVKSVSFSAWDTDKRPPSPEELVEEGLREGFYLALDHLRELFDRLEGKGQVGSKE